jgi:hypothetical protein
MSKDYDFINPSHYKNSSKETWQMMVDIWGVEKYIAYCEMNNMKYRMRAGLKPEQTVEQDLKKANWYADKVKELRKSEKPLEERMEDLIDGYAPNAKCQHDWKGNLGMAFDRDMVKCTKCGSIAKGCSHTWARTRANFSNSKLTCTVCGEVRHEAHGIPKKEKHVVTLVECQEAVARASGYKTWDNLVKTINGYESGTCRMLMNDYNRRAQDMYDGVSERLNRGV